MFAAVRARAGASLVIQRPHIGRAWSLPVAGNRIRTISRQCEAAWPNRRVLGCGPARHR